jgi:effector-binding domain-containing protein
MSTDTEPQIVELPVATTAVVRGVVPVAELSAFFDRAFPTVGAVLGRQGIVPAGPGFALYHGAPASSADLEVGFVTDRAVEPTDGVEAGTLPGGRAARLVHAGGYDGLGTAWERLRSWIEARGLTPAGDVWEVYVTRPTPSTDPADLRTELYWPLA